MKLELDDFTPLARIEDETDLMEDRSKDEQQKEEDIKSFYEHKIKELENRYKELVAQVSQESYEKALEDARKEYERKLKTQIEQVVQQKEREKQEILAHSSSRLQDLEKGLFERYRTYIERVQEILVENVGALLEFLYIDKRNSKNVKEAIEKIFDEFANYMPLTLQVSSSLYDEAKKNFHSIDVKENRDLKENEFIIEFHDFKIENRIKNKLSVIKDEIKREIRKNT